MISAMAKGGWVALFGAPTVIAAMDATEFTLSLAGLAFTTGLGVLGVWQKQSQSRREVEERKLQAQAAANAAETARTNHFVDQMQEQLDRVQTARSADHVLIEELQTTVVQVRLAMVRFEIGARRLVAQVFDLGGVPVWDPDGDESGSPEGSGGIG